MIGRRNAGTEALQAATLNPAKSFEATDSLGTVTPGKLADLVLLDADPLADIANVLKVRAVVANGRYFDHAALRSTDPTGARLAADCFEERRAAGRSGKGSAKRKAPRTSEPLEGHEIVGHAREELSR